MGLMLQSLCGLIVIPLIAWVLCEQRDAVPLRKAAGIAAGGIALQFGIAGLFILIPQLSLVFDLLAGAVLALQTATGAGMKFLFGYLAGGPTPFTVTDPDKGFVLALQALPIILMMSVLARLLFHFGILQKVVGFLAWLLGRSMGVSGPVGTVAAANVVVGLVDAPILVRPYLATVSRGGLFAMMTTGMATVAGTVMALYATFLQPVLAGAAGHILLASVMSAPAALVIARLMVPWTDDGDTTGTEQIDDAFKSRSVMEAIATGTTDGIRLVVSVSAMLVVMVALVALVDMALSAATSPFGLSISAQQIFGWAMSTARTSDRDTLERSGTGRPVDRREDRAQRTDCIFAIGGYERSGAVGSQQADSDLCIVRFRQFRFPRDHDRWSDGTVSGQTSRYPVPWSALAGLGHLVNLDDWCRDWRNDPALTAA